MGDFRKQKRRQYSGEQQRVRVPVFHWRSSNGFTFCVGFGAGMGAGGGVGAAVTVGGGGGRGAPPPP